jgi:hypothetical protein
LRFGLRAGKPFDDTGINLLIAQQGQHVLQTGFALDGADFDPLDAPSLRVFFSLSIGQVL